MKKCQTEYMDKLTAYMGREEMLFMETSLPECSATGDYEPVQCDQIRGTCHCVVPTTGAKIPGASTPMPNKPNCESEILSLRFFFCITRLYKNKVYLLFCLIDRFSMVKASQKLFYKVLVKIFERETTNRKAWEF